MSHSRNLIRSAVVAMLEGNTAAGANVYPNRETSLWESELPAILVYTKKESAERRDLSGRTSVRTLDLTIEIKADATDSVDDDLDNLAKEVEDIISSDPSLTATALSAVLTDTEVTLDASSDTEKGVLVMSFEVKYIA